MVNREDILKKIDLRQIEKFYIVRKQKYYCEVCGEETTRPKICRKCFIKLYRQEVWK